MMRITNYLIEFKDLKITKAEFRKKVKKNLFSVLIDDPVVIYASDVVNLLHAYANEKVTLEHLIDWVNVVWFTDLLDYDDHQSDSIASVLNELEELDEEGKELTEKDIEDYISALEENQVWIAAPPTPPPLSYPIYVARTYPDQEGPTIVYSFGYDPDNLFAKFGVNSERHTHYDIATTMTVDKETLEIVTGRLYEFVKSQLEQKFPQKLVIERDGVSGVEW